MKTGEDLAMESLRNNFRGKWSVVTQLHFHGKRFPFSSAENSCRQAKNVCGQNDAGGVHIIKTTSILLQISQKMYVLLN